MRREAKPGNIYRCANAVQVSDIHCAASSSRTACRCCSAKAISRPSTAPDPAVRSAFANIVKETRLNLMMIEAAMRGAQDPSRCYCAYSRAGSSSMFWTRCTSRRPGTRPNPIHSRGVDERYKVSGSDLIRNGYTIDDPDGQYWFSRCWDKKVRPGLNQCPSANRPADHRHARSVSHKLGAVPIVWIRNFLVDRRPAIAQTAPARSPPPCIPRSKSTISSVRLAADSNIAVIQPCLLKDPALPDGELIKGAGNALIVSEKGDARLLEIGGTASAAVIEYVRTLA